MTRERFARLVDETRFEPLFDFAAERACHDFNVALAMALGAKNSYYWGRAFRVLNGGRP